MRLNSWDGRPNPEKSSRAEEAAANIQIQNRDRQRVGVGRENHLDPALAALGNVDVLNPHASAPHNLQ